MNNTSTIIVTDKTQLIYLAFKGVEPKDVERVDNQVRVTYEYNEEFKKANLKYVSDNEFKKFMMAKRVIDQLLRTTI